MQKWKTTSRYWPSSLICKAYSEELLIIDMTEPAHPGGPIPPIWSNNSLIQSLQSPLKFNMEILWGKKKNYQKLQKNSPLRQANISFLSSNGFSPYWSSIKWLHFPNNAHNRDIPYIQGYKLTGTAFPALSNSIFPSSYTRIPMSTR